MSINNNEKPRAAGLEEEVRVKKLISEIQNAASADPAEGRRLKELAATLLVDLQDIKKAAGRKGKKLDDLRKKYEDKKSEILAAVDVLKNKPVEVAPEKEPEPEVLIAVEQALEQQEEKDVEELQSAAVVENDVEFVKFKNHYFVAEKELEEFVAYAREHLLEDAGDEVLGLKNDLEELKRLLEQKNYSEFAKKYEAYRDVLESLYSEEVVEEAKTVKAEEIVNPPDKPVEPRAEEVVVKKPKLSREVKEGLDKLAEAYDKDTGAEGPKISPEIKAGLDKLAEAYDTEAAQAKKPKLSADVKAGLDKLAAEYDKKVEVEKPEPADDTQADLDRMATDYDSATVIKEPVEKPVQPEPAVVEKEIVKPEDAEYKEWGEKYADAKFNLAELVALIKKHKLEQGLEGEIKKMENRLAELESLLQSKDYKSLKKKYDRFDLALEDLFSQLDLYKGKEGAKELEAVIEAGKDLPDREAEKEEGVPVFGEATWKKMKEYGKKIVTGIFNRETGKMAGKVTYDTVTSVLGVKLATDAARWLVKGDGDLADWWQGRKESKFSKEVIGQAYQDLLESFEQAKTNKTLEESEKIAKRLANFKEKVESAKITPEAKKALLDKLWAITIKHQQDNKLAVAERNAEVKRLLDAYVQGKVSTMKIARDALNLVFTASGLSMLRGAAYATTSALDRAGGAAKEFAKEKLGGGGAVAEAGYVAKDVLVNSTIETVRALMGQGDKKGGSVKTRTIDFVKALGTVARSFGIYGVAFRSGDSIEQSIDKLILKLKEQGMMETISGNFVQNAERVAHLVAHPADVFKRPKDQVKPKAEHHDEVAVAPEPVKEIATAPEPIIVHHEQPPEPVVISGAEIAAKKPKTSPEEIHLVENNPRVSVAEEEIIPTPEPAVTQVTLAEILDKRGVDKIQFIKSIQDMRNEMAECLENSLIRTEGSNKFLQEKITYLYELQEDYKVALYNDIKLNDVGSQRVEDLLRAESLFKSGKNKWIENLDKTVFDKDDEKVLQLAFASHKTPGKLPILTNNSNAVRIWDAATKKDVFWYEKGVVFNTDENGNLVIQDASGRQVIDKEEAVRMANE